MAGATEVFPLRRPFGITVVFGKTKRVFEGWSPIDPIIEVLVDVGMIADERLEDLERELQDTEAGERYQMTIEPSHPQDDAYWRGILGNGGGY
jgi:hypothetical protein